MGNPPPQNRKRRWNWKKSGFTEIFEEFLENYPEWSEISEIVRRNSRAMGRRGQANIWIIGGFVYRPIIKALYGPIKEPSQTDIDFLISRGPASEEVYAPKGWEIKRTEAGYFYMEKEKIRIDPNYLYSFHSIGLVAGAMGSLPKFKHFFKATPMDIQSIAYDLTDRSIGVIGDLGIKAIKTRKVRVNNLEEAIFESQKRGMKLENFVREKAEELGFGWNLAPIHQIPHIKENHSENEQKIPAWE